MKRIKLMALAGLLALAVAGVAGCGQKAPGTQQAEASKSGTPDISKKVDLVVGGLDRGNSSDDKYWPSMVVDAIEKKLNVNLKLVNYDQQKLGMDLASGELPDVMMVYQINMDSVIKGKHAVPLNHYFDTIGKELDSSRYRFRNSVMSKFQSGGDGNVYFTTPSVTTEGEGEVNATSGYLIRWDLYKQIGAPEIDTPEDYIQALQKMQKLYPKTPDGLPVYAYGMDNDLGLSTWIYHGVKNNSTYNSLDGDHMYLYDAKTHQVSHDVVNDDPNTPFWADMHYYNEMWKDGLLDPDCFITKGDDLVSKYSKGQYLGGSNNWTCGTYNQTVQKDPGSTAGMVLLPWHNTMQGGIFPDGWNDKLIFVSAHSKNIDRAVMFLNYISSEEFARLQYSGKEGENWKKDDKGVPAITQSTIDMKADPAQSDAFNKLGLSGWINWGGVGADAILSDGYTASLWDAPSMLSKGLSPTDQDMCKTLGISYPLEYGKKLVQEGKFIDNSTSSKDMRFQVLLPPRPQDITRIDGNIKEIVTNALPVLVQAPDDASFEAARKKLIADVKGANMERSLKWWQDNVSKALQEMASIDQGQ